MTMLTPECREWLEMFRDQLMDNRHLPPDTSPEPPRRGAEEFGDFDLPRCPDCGQRGDRHLGLCAYD